MLHELFKTQELILQSFIISVITSLTLCIDGQVKDVAGLKASLEFSQKDIADYKDHLELIDTGIGPLLVVLPISNQRQINIRRWSI